MARRTCSGSAGSTGVRTIPAGACTLSTRRACPSSTSPTRSRRGSNASGVRLLIRCALEREHVTRPVVVRKIHVQLEPHELPALAPEVLQVLEELARIEPRVDA